MTKQVRMVYLDGPGDSIHSFRDWRRDGDTQDVTHVPFSRQFYDVCESLKAKVWIIGEHPRIERIEDGNFVIEHRGNPSENKHGGAYHASELAIGMRLVAEIIRFKPDVVITHGRPYPFLMQALKPFGIKVLLIIHCTLWPKYGTLSSSERMLQAMNAQFYRSGCDGVIAVSEDIKRQIRLLAGENMAPFVDFLPLFRADTFEGASAADPLIKPFRVLFAGRVERDKGVFDLLEIAKRMRARNRTDVVFELCGDGSDYPALRAEVERNGLSETFVLRGWCDRAQMRDAFARCHVTVVPTTTRFIEGFNMVIAESVLAQRPVITSDVCPAVEYLSGGVIEVQPDDWSAYERAIMDLASDPERYRELYRACATAGQRFLDEQTSIGSALTHSLQAIWRGERIVPREIAPQLQA